MSDNRSQPRISLFSPEHPLWLVGFRPFFTLVCLSGVVLPLLWAVLWTKGLSPSETLSNVQWHAHEMFFGFGWALLGGFLLTSTKNWVNIRGYHGLTLMALVLAWCLERVSLLMGPAWPRLVFLLANNLFLVGIIGLLLWTLIRYRGQDSYRDNGFFILALPLFVVAKQWLLDPASFQQGVDMALALFRLAFIIMLERTLVPFMKGGLGIVLPAFPRLGFVVKGLAFALVFNFALPTALTVTFTLLLAAGLLFRFLRWSPLKAFTRIDIGIMYVGWLAIIGQLLLTVLAVLAPQDWVGTLSIHVFTFGAMGCIIPAMVTRISRGHTGRKVAFDGVDRAILYVMLLAFLIRIVLPQWFPGLYLAWIHAAATAWALGFAGLAWRNVPFLWQARIDGRVH